MNRLRTLVVDDNPEFLETAAELVRDNALCDLCGVAHSGFQALGLVARQAPDLVLLDVQLGDLNGFTVASAIRSVMPECRVVMMSLHDDSEYRSHSIEIGALGFIAKSEFIPQFDNVVEAIAANDASH